MASWQELETELDQWSDAGRKLELWWRDDDATKPTEALERLLALASNHKTHIALAVIPQKAKPELATHLQDVDNVQVLQHGFAHANHAPSSEKKQEFGPHRGLKTMLGDIFAGAKCLEPFANRCPVFVPPWNRIDAKLLPVLPGFGVRGISTYGLSGEEKAVPGITRVNTHIDPVNWKGGRSYAGDSTVLALLLDHLKAKREGLVGADEPTGLLTHHLVHDEDIWTFIARLLDLTSRHRAVEWLSAGEAFGFDNKKEKS